MDNWILTPVRGALHLTRAAMDTFLAQDIGDVRVLLIDNDSPDNTANWAWTLYPQVLITTFRPGLSVAKSWNRGLEYLFNTVKKVLVVNNDVQLRPDTYLELAADGGGFVTAVGTDDPKKIEPPLVLDKRGTRRPHPDFSCFLIRKWVWEKAGGFDESYESAYVEDAEFHLKLHRSGIQANCIDLPFLHVGGGSQTLENMEVKGESDKVREDADRNRELFRSRHGCVPGEPEYEDLFSKESFGMGHGLDELPDDLD